MLKRGHHGTPHNLSERHLSRFIAGFVDRNNDRDLDTFDIMTETIASMVGKLLSYKELIA